MKVLYLQHGLGYGGATKSLLVMQKSLHDKIEIHTITKKNKRLNKFLKKEFIYSKDIKEVDIDGVYSYSEGISSYKDLIKAQRCNIDEIITYINQHTIDILHINSSVFCNILKQIKEKTNCKIVVHFREILKHQGNHLIDQYIINQAETYADAIIGISANEVAYFNNKTFIIPNPHDFSETDSYLKKKNLDKKEITIGMCSNFNPIKGHLIFLDAIKIVNEKNLSHTVRFKIIGYPIFKNKLVQFIKTYILGNNYLKTFHKKLNQLQIKNLTIVPFNINVFEHLLNIDIYIRPDLSGNPWGRDIIEAMALKLPIIATGNSNVFITENKTGFLIEPGNANQLSEKIIELINNPILMKQMGENGYDQIKNQCDINIYSNNILNVYRKILAN